MNPSSLIKQQLKQKLKFENEDNDDLAGDITNTVSGNNISRLFTPSKNNPKTISILSFLNGSDKINVNVDETTTYYHYPIDFLDKDFENLNVTQYKKVNLCIYTINTTKVKPFMLWLLNKNGNTMYWPNFQPKTNIVSESEKRLRDLSIYNKSKCMGYKSYDNQVFIFYNLEDNYETVDYCKDSTPFWWSTLHEIILAEYILYFTVHDSVRNVFLRDNRLIYLLDKDNHSYELPSVAFNGSHSHTMDYNVKVGLGQANPAWASQGPYYYFANYLRAAKFGSWNVMGNFQEHDIDGEIITDNEHGRFKKGGVIRFIIFPSRIKVVMNRPWDKENKQVPSLQKEIIETSKEYKLKLYDSKGTWTKEYDSVFLGPLEIEKNVFVHSGISWTLKSYFQYKPLSYHYFDKKTIPEKYTPDLDKDIDVYKNKSFPYFKII